MKRLPLILALGLLPGCAFNPTGRADFDPEATAVDVPSAPCRTAVPTPEDFSDGDFVLGIVTRTEPATTLFFKAWPHVDDEHFSVTVQPHDAVTGELAGEPQLIEAGLLDGAGRFAIDEVILDIPDGVMGPEQERKAGLAAVEGGFCLRSASIQGTFEGWTFGPEPTEAGGFWFIARETE